MNESEEPVVIICGGGGHWGPWKATKREYPDRQNKDVICQKCARYVPAHETVCREHIEPEGSWYGNYIEFQCAPGCGCRKEPKKRKAYHLLAWRFDDGGGDNFYLR